MEDAPDDGEVIPEDAGATWQEEHLAGGEAAENLEAEAEERLAR